MSLHTYKAMNPSGRLIRGQMDAANPVDLEMRLKRMDLDYISGHPVRSRGLFGGIKVTRRDLINFCFHLEQLTRSGVPILEGLTDLRGGMGNPRFVEVIAGMIESIEGGRTLSQAMSEHPGIFDLVIVSLVRAGEDSGNLPEVLKNLTDTLRWQDELASHARKIVMYPCFLCVVVLCVTLFMMLYLVPKIAVFIRNLGQELPFQTRLLLATSDFLVSYWYAVLGGPVLVVVLIAVVVRGNPRARFRFDDLKLRLPWVGEILRKIILSRFAAVFAMMYTSGISVLESIRATEDVVGNLVIRDGLKRAGEMISDGHTVTLAFQRVGLFPSLVVRMLHVGENTGALDTALSNVSYFYNRDVRESIERVQTMIEPAMTAMVGLILGWVILSVLGPIYDTVTRLKM